MALTKVALPNGLTVVASSATDTEIVYREIFETEFYRQHGMTFAEGDCLLDIGANSGLFVLYVNQICRRARILAFEPVPAIFEALRRNVEAHDRLGTQIFNQGVSREVGQGTFTYYPRMSAASSMYPDESPGGVPLGQEYVLEQFDKLPWPVRWPFALCPRRVREFLANCVCKFHLKSQSVTCPLTTVSTLIDEHRLERIDFLKIDAEGSEYDILAGIRDAHWPRIRQMVVEVHDGETAARNLCQELEQRGYTVALEQNAPFRHIFLVYARRESQPA